MKQNRVLGIDDDKDLCMLIERELKQENYAVTVMYDGKTGLEAFKPGEYQPFLLSEFAARTHSLIRRYTVFNGQDELNGTLNFTGLEINYSLRSVYVNHTEVRLTGKEFDLLYFLASNQGRVFTKEQIYHQVWKDYLDVLETNAVTKEEQDKFLKIAMTKAQSLNSYIQSLFEWLKLESGEWAYDFKMLDICELTRTVLADWILKLEENNIKFQFVIPEEAVCIRMDENAYTRIVNNLLTNMIGHSQATQLSVQISESAHGVNLEVADNGVGIAEKDLPFIFDRLYKCDSSRTENSNGLGLAIAKELAHALQGELTAESCVGKGTAFQLRFLKNMKNA